MGGARSIQLIQGSEGACPATQVTVSANTEYAALIPWIIICIYVSDLEFWIPEREILFYISDWPHLTQNADLIQQIFDDNLILRCICAVAFYRLKLFIRPNSDRYYKKSKYNLGFYINHISTQETNEKIRENGNQLNGNEKPNLSK